MKSKKSLTVPALEINQWLRSWDDVQYSNDKDSHTSTIKRRRKPSPTFYMFSLSALTLTKLAEVYPRKLDGRRDEEPGIQRMLQDSRTEEINRFIEHGFPWSTLPRTQRTEDKNNALHMPGWLPTAIIANILAPNTKRNGKTIEEKDLIRLNKGENGIISVILPDDLNQDDWKPTVFPLEIIDGQHRLKAFELNDSDYANFELPVVAFYDLDIAWQAYLFYTINIKPVKINPSLAYDLYPLLRVQEWLEQANDNLTIYRETRAQELTEILWSNDLSPWKARINMLGTSRGMVSQSAVIKSLLDSFLGLKKKTTGGGLFQVEIQWEFGNVDTLNWDRALQAALLLLIWHQLAIKVSETKEEWAEAIRRDKGAELDLQINELDPAFAHKTSLLSQDQGLHAVMRVSNDLIHAAAVKLKLQDIQKKRLPEDEIDTQEITSAYERLFKAPIGEFIERMAEDLAIFDWRSADAGSLDPEEKLKKKALRGSGGYKESRQQILTHMMASKHKDIKQAAKLALKTL